MKNIKVVPGARFDIPVGCTVSVSGKPSVRTSQNRTVTVRSVELTNTGQCLIVWKSHGRRASTVLN